MPVGVQIVGRPWEEEALLELGVALGSRAGTVRGSARTGKPHNVSVGAHARHSGGPRKSAIAAAARPSCWASNSPSPNRLTVVPDGISSVIFICTSVMPTIPGAAPAKSGAFTIGPIVQHHRIGHGLSSGVAGTKNPSTTVVT